jgi:uncharacterized membrane protein
MRERRKRRKLFKPKRGLPYGKRNYIIFGVGLFLALLGFVFLLFGDTFWSPILMVLGYAVLIPISLYYSFKTKKKEVAQD